MNIFVLDYDPTICAQYHGNKHVIKMIAESAQLLSTAHRIIDGKLARVNHPVNNKLFKMRLLPGESYEFYSKLDSKSMKYTHGFTYTSLFLKPTHEQHPCAIWARESDSNYQWLVNLTIELCKEYTHRYGKVHLYQRNGLIDLLKTPPNGITSGPLTEFAQAMPDEYRHADPISAYRRYYLGSKQKLLEYKNRATPVWISI